MRLLRQIIIKSLDLAEEFELNRSNFKSICFFYHAYGLSLNVVGNEDSNIERKNKLFKKLIDNYLKGKFDIKSYNHIKEFMKKDISVINDALNLIDKKVEELGGDMGELDKENELFVGILSFDFPTGG